jgi:hypothetical protein
MRLKRLLMMGVMIGGLPVLATETIELKGTYTWNPRKDNEYEVTAVVTPCDDGGLAIAYETTWNKKPQSYKGKIEGDLSDGDVTGTAVDAAGKRRWVVRGKAKDGVITCDHWEIKGEGDARKEVHTGLVVLRRQRDG